MRIWPGVLRRRRKGRSVEVDVRSHDVRRVGVDPQEDALEETVEA